MEKIADVKLHYLILFMSADELLSRPKQDPVILFEKAICF